MTLQRILIANRGEIAVRLIHAAHLCGAGAVAVYSDVDADAPHVRLADDARYLGPAPSAESYLNAERIIAAAQASDCQAIHPGYGFLSENAAFAGAVRAAGLVFIGPPSEAIRMMGDKTAARARMAAAGVPILPGADGSLDDLLAHSYAFPVLVKASAGGGGKGMRIVHRADDLPDALHSAAREAEKAFGDARLYIEQYLPSARHIEIQVLGDSHGNLLHLFERECSVQRRHQKIIEEAPAPGLSADVRDAMAAAALDAARAVGYENAGTVEFILDADTNAFYFLEMNTRLQVEHPVTEAITGLDLAAWQIRIAAGEALTLRQDDLHPRGHAIECRLYAEDPAHGFLPATGEILLHEAPHMPGVRVDSGIASGDVVTTHYDPMLAKLIAWGDTREAARARLLAALRAYHVLGVTTNRAFLADALAHPAFIAGVLTTHFIAEHFADWHPAPPSDEQCDLALIFAALATTAAPTSSDEAAPGFTPWERADHFRLGRD